MIFYLNHHYPKSNFDKLTHLLGSLEGWGWTEEVAEGGGSGGLGKSLAAARASPMGLEDERRCRASCATRLQQSLARSSFRPQISSLHPASALRRTSRRAILSVTLEI